MSKDLVDGLSKFKYNKDHLCSACEQGKSKKAPLPSKLVPSTESKLELLHMDLCGPMRVASMNGKKYILVIVDAYSRYTWVYFLCTKDEAPNMIIDFINQVQRNLKAQNLTTRTDNGTEFKNEKLQAFYAKLVQFEPHVLASKAKKAAKNLDLLAPLAHLNASSSQSHANSSYSPQPYYVTHPSSVVDDKDEYQGELQGDSQEDKLTTAMILLARAITHNFSTPTNNHLSTSLNTRNQAMVQDGRVDIQTKNAGYGGNANRNSGRQNRNQAFNAGNGNDENNHMSSCSHELSQLRERQMFSVITAMKKATMPVISENEENDFMLDNSYGEETMQESTIAVMLMARIQPADGNAKTVPSYDAKAVSEVNASSKVHEQLARKDFKEREIRYIEDIVDLKEKLSSHDRIVYKMGQLIQTINMLGKKPNKVYDPFLKAGLGYKNLERLKKAIAAQPKIYDGERLHSAKLTIDSPDLEGTLEDAEESRLKMRNKMNLKELKEELIEEVHEMLNIFASMEQKVIQIVLWIVDSGCSKHMTSNLQLLRNFVKKFMVTVRFGNDHFAAITGYGDYVQVNLMICHVYYVEGLGHNLFSVRQFCDGDLEHPKQKKAAKNHDLLTLLAHLNASSSQSHANSSYSPQLYYVTHLSSVVDDKDEYQGELQGDSQEDKLTTAMMLLARAITYNFSTPTNNHLCTSSNTRNQAMVQDGRVDIQTKNAGYGGNANRNSRRQNRNQAFNAGNGNDDSNQIVQRVPQTESTPGKANVQCYNCNEKGHYACDYNSYGEETMQESTIAVMLMLRIQPADGNAETVPSYDAKAVSEVNASSKVHEQLARKDFKEREIRYIEDIVDLKEKLSSHDRIVYKMGQLIQTINMLGKKPNKVYDPFLKAGLGYKNL
ncbi:integrase, catalytic region, zinc finger, CCHC-type containing protein [Tanacetum coccineum]|uniref:Integrase, catalytic region, zinc finger, CCHC-type containing protein n=1 Tax=Tanacetum coccineum TaxID=301880 RepID=A0ABQ4ZR90_9ASTR